MDNIRLFRERRIEDCRDCPYMQSQASWYYCSAVHAPYETGVCPQSGIRSDCPLPEFTPSVDATERVTPARLRQLLAREAALKALVKSATAEGGWGYYEAPIDVWDDDWQCVACYSDKVDDHAPDCALAAAIEAAQEEDEA